MHQRENAVCLFNYLVVVCFILLLINFSFKTFQVSSEIKDKEIMKLEWIKTKSPDISPYICTEKGENFEGVCTSGGNKQNKNKRHLFNVHNNI